MEKNIRLNRRDFLKFTGLAAGTALLGSCTDYVESQAVDISPIMTGDVYPTPGAVSPTPIEENTATPEAKEIVATPETPVENNFKLGAFDLGQPFTLTENMSLRIFLGFIPSKATFSATTSLPIVTSLENADPEGIYDRSRFTHALGFPFLAFRSANPNEKVIYPHSLQAGAVGTAAYKIGAFAYNNPEKVDKLYTYSVVLEQDDLSFEARIAYVSNIDIEQWKGTKEKSPWFIDENGEVFINTTMLDIPELTDLNKVRLIIATCQSEEVGTPSDLLEENNGYTSLIVLEFDRPQ